MFGGQVSILKNTRLEQDPSVYVTLPKFKLQLDEVHSDNSFSFL